MQDTESLFRVQYRLARPPSTCGQEKRAYRKGRSCYKIALIQFSLHYKPAVGGACRAPYNTEPVIAVIKIYICVTIKNIHLILASVPDTELLKSILSNGVLEASFALIFGL